MNLRRNKKGIGLPTVLAIVTFIIGTAASLLSITFSQTKLVDTNIENTETYQNAVYNVDAAVRVMIREMINDNQFLTVDTNIDELEAYFNVEITPHETVSSLWKVTSLVSNTRAVTSYVSTVAGVGGTVEDTSNLLAFFSEFISGNSKSLPEEVLNQILPSYFETFEVDELSAPKKNDLESIKKIVQYITDKTTFISISQQLLNLDNQVLDGNFYHDRTLTIYSGNTLELADGRILFVNGDLIMKANSNLIGNV
ncbi:MAG: hypothetical protein RBT45_01360, partial [Acholeplasmataceae bacterium]|nr:hypothetical protein [Acholeplasmataceae bacterium]